MPISKSPRNMLVGGMVLGLSLAAVAAALGARALRPAEDFSQVMRKDGFDFTELRAPDKP